MTTASDTSSCPDCQSRTVRWRNTLTGVLWAVLCFPCGIYCCLKRRQQHCSQCDCDVGPRLLSFSIQLSGTRQKGKKETCSTCGNTSSSAALELLPAPFLLCAVVRSTLL
ncbi:unnamed protein product [Heligmosomoides polygyrus]|uniref:Brain protein I3 n=1 Tax=Heligmosomoides polygyrus TaxID=6339 RepID=A0A183GIZ2_HELPZ|nr:unnamed protein product [Heligmosomoides polygyrus]